MSKARQLADLGNQVDDGAITGSNMVVNGAMNVAQRSSSVTGVNAGGYYACDRAQVYFSSIDQMVTTVSQDTDAPDGFTKSHKVLVTTAETSVASNDLHSMLWYHIEGQDLQHLGYGNANAKPMTVSFWVKSNVTGTYTLSFYASIGGTNSVVTPTYTINAANTWEYKTITISGSTIGALVNSNSIGLQLYWNGLVGSQYTSGTQATSWSTYVTSNWAVGHTADFGLDVNDYWQITGVCLNVGDSAIDFPHESYGDTLAKCQRYYQKSFQQSTAPVAGEGSTDRIPVISWSSSYCGGYTVFPVRMRATPSIALYRDNTSGTLASGSINVYTGAAWVERTATAARRTETGFTLDAYASGAFAVGNGYISGFNYTADAEL
jgi:hypothetical protein